MWRTLFLDSLALFILQPFIKQEEIQLAHAFSESESELALLPGMFAHEEFVSVLEAPQCDRMTVTRQDTDNTNNNIQNRQCVKIAHTQYTK